MNPSRFSFLSLLLAVLSFSGIRAQAQMFGGSHSIAGITYTYDTSSDDGTYQTDTYLDGNGNSVTLRGRIGASVAVAEVSGAYEGVFDGSNFNPLSVSTSPISINITSPNGRGYSQQFDRTTWTVDLANDTVNVSERTIYSGSSGEFSTPVGGADGSIEGSEGGVVYQGQLLFNYSSSATWPLGTGASVQLFGTTYFKVSETSNTWYDYAGNAGTSTTATYQSADQGVFTHSEHQPPEQTWADVGMAGNDPHVGNWSASGGTPSAPGFNAMESPRFAPQAFWVNGTVVNWTETGITNASGTITDSFSAENITVKINGNARSFHLGNNPATVAVSLPGGTYTGSIALNGAVTGFNSAVCDVQFNDPNRSTPLFSAATLYVDGVPHVFAGGFEDSAGTRTDRYDHDGSILTLRGGTSTPASAAVQMGTHQGTFSSGVFIVPDCEILTTLLEGPPAFWVNGVLYTKGSGTSAYSSAASPPQSFALSGEVISELALSGTISGSVLSGSFNAEQGGVFNVTLGGFSRLACPAEVNGAPRQGPSLESLNGAGGLNPEFAGLPAAIRIPITGGPQPHAVLDFLGLATDDDTTGDLVACYGYAKVPESDPTSYWKQNLLLLKIRPATGTSKAVTLRDYRAAKTTDGFYDTSSRLFQAELKVSTASIKALPMPVMSLEPANNYAFWFIDAAAGGLPRSFIIRGQPWWYAGEVGGQQVYRGFYTEQEMTLPVTADANGQRLVKLKDYAFDTNRNLTPGTTNETQGTLSGVRSSIRFRDNTLAFSGTESGTPQAVTPVDDFTLHTIRSDVDIVGNNLSFGILNNDASLAGAVWGFRDGGSVAKLHSVLSRSSAEWYWWKQDGSSIEASRAVMVLDEYQRLQIYPPPPTSNANPGIVLNPIGTSSFKGPVRVAPGGDISMGGYSDGTPP